MCSSCLRSNRTKEIEKPEEELWALFRTAYLRYKSEVVNGNKLYHRYANDFLYDNLTVDSMEYSTWKQHVSNINRVFELLNERYDLVELFFSGDDFTKDDYDRMIDMFNTVEKNLSLPSTTIACLSHDQLAAITEFTNTNNFFVDKVDIETMQRFFNGSVDTPLQVTNNGFAGYFFIQLWIEGFATKGILLKIEKAELLCSAYDKKLLTARKLSSNKNQFKNGDIIRKILDLMKELKRLKICDKYDE